MTPTYLAGEEAARRSRRFPSSFVSVIANPGRYSMYPIPVSLGRFAMTEDENVVQSPFARIRAFGWHEAKRASNLRAHRIDFQDVKGIFDGYTFIRRSDRHGEVRYQVFGYVDGREVAVACALRGEQCWVISARRARKDERRKYYRGLAGRSPTGED